MQEFEVYGEITIEICSDILADDEQASLHKFKEYVEQMLSLNAHDFISDYKIKLYSSEYATNNLSEHQ